MRKLIMAVTCVVLAFASFGAQSSAAKYSVIRKGHGIKFDRMDVNSRRSLNYAVVCFDAIPDADIHEFTPVFSENCATLLKREILDDKTWGFVFQINHPMPFMVFDVCTTGAVVSIGAPEGKGCLKFRRPIAFWMPIESARSRRVK